jgi:ATP-dependent DNA ligase
MVFEKYDGWYGYVDFSGGFYTPVSSRAKRHIPAMAHFAEHVVNSSKVDKLSGRLVFEILLEGVTDFPTLNGVLNRKKEQAPGAYIMCHDLIFTGNKDKEFIDRYADLRKYFEPTRYVRIANPLSSNKKFNSWAPVCNLQESRKLCEDVWRRGGEGVILKRADAPYSPGKRNADLMKIKEEIALDLLVTGLIER